MTDRVLRRTGFPPFVESGDWRASLMAHVRGVRHTFLGNPVLTDLILIRGALTPLARRLGEQETQKAIESMIEAGLDDQTAHDTYSAVHVFGSIGTRPGVGTARKVGAKARRSAEDGGWRRRRTPNAPVPPDDRAFERLLTSLLASALPALAD